MEVTQRVQNLQFANKTLKMCKMLHRIDEVAELMEAIENLPEGNPLEGNPAYEAREETWLCSCPKNYL